MLELADRCEGGNDNDPGRPEPKAAALHLTRCILQPAAGLVAAATQALQFTGALIAELGRRSG